MMPRAKRIPVLKKKGRKVKLINIQLPAPKAMERARTTNNPHSVKTKKENNNFFLENERDQAREKNSSTFLICIDYLSLYKYLGR
jgi:hypothetical protein